MKTLFAFCTILTFAQMTKAMVGKAIGTLAQIKVVAPYWTAATAIFSATHFWFKKKSAGAPG